MDEINQNFQGPPDSCGRCSAQATRPSYYQAREKPVEERCRKSELACSGLHSASSDVEGHRRGPPNQQPGFALCVEDTRQGALLQAQGFDLADMTDASHAADYDVSPLSIRTDSFTRSGWIWTDGLWLFARHRVPQLCYSASLSVGIASRSLEHGGWI